MAATPARLARRGPFERLPDEIIEQIFLAADPSGFASLVVVNTKWRAVSQQPHLYLHHLAASTQACLPGSDDDDGDLPRLRRLFARQVKRNLFHSYLRPKETVIKLVSKSISSSSCPGGEGMQFGASPRGHHILAYNSSRIHVIDVRGPTLEIKRELKILRRPVSVCMTDDASLLAVLSTEMQVDVHDLQRTPPRRTQSLALANSSRAIALSSCGSVLAAAYDGGIEVSSLHPAALPTDRRAVKCDAVDALAFSLDGTQILGTTIHSSPPSTVVLTAPYYDPGSQLPGSSLSAMWTTSILFPNSSRDCSHAILLQDGNHGEAEWTFTYDRSFESFRAVRLDDLRNGTTYFTGPMPGAASQSKLPCTLPASTYHGELVAAAFEGKEVWIYGVPGELDALPEPASGHANSSSSSSGLGRPNSLHSGLSRHASSTAQDSDNEKVPKWQVLCDKLRNNFVAGCKISELAGISSVKWVAGFAGQRSSERLVVTARGVSGPRLATEDEDMDFADGGRIALLDFDYGLVDGDKSEVTIEVGTDAAEALEEEMRDMETEVALVRRRTVAQKRGGGAASALLRAATGSARDSPAPPLSLPADDDNGDDDDDDDPLVSRTVGRNPASRPSVAGMAGGGEAAAAAAASIEEQEALDAPYAHASPRSGTTLLRAATAAAVNRMRNPRTADGRPIEYRRADGRAEHPHESDADNWVPPPPPYQKEDPGDLPAFLRGPSVAPPPSPPLGPAVATTEKGRRRLSYQRTASASTMGSRLRVERAARPRSTPSARSFHVDPDNIYDVSPPASPSPRTRQSGSPLAQESERGPGAAPSSSAMLRAGSFHAQPSAPSGSAPASGWAAPMGGNVLARSSMPLLQLHIPHASSSDPEPVVRRPWNVPTWPLLRQSRAGAGAGAGSTQAMAGHPWTAPAFEVTGRDLAEALPPPPSFGQIASLSRRISQGNPRRLSGGMQIQQVLANSRSADEGPDEHAEEEEADEEEEEEEEERQLHDYLGNASMDMPEFDRPLIISTPKGVSGAFDPPGRYAPGEPSDTQILAPIPRHPRLNTLINHPPATVAGLETMCGARAEAADSPADGEPRPTAVPWWVRAASAASSAAARTASPRRAEGSSAARDARRSRRTGRKARRRPASVDASAAAEVASSAGWTDVSGRSAPKERKCVVM